MVSVTFKGFKNLKQAKAFIEWYSGQGEQDAYTWFEADGSLESANVDVSNTFPLKVKDDNIDVNLTVE